MATVEEDVFESRRESSLSGVCCSIEQLEFAFTFALQEAMMTLLRSGCEDGADVVSLISSSDKPDISCVVVLDDCFVGAAVEGIIEGLEPTEPTELCESCALRRLPIGLALAIGEPPLDLFFFLLRLRCRVEEEVEKEDAPPTTGSDAEAVTIELDGP